METARPRPSPRVAPVALVNQGSAYPMTGESPLGTHTGQLAQILEQLEQLDQEPPG